LQPPKQSVKQQKETKEQKKLGREQLQRVIEMMKGIEDHTVDPFLLNVDEIIRIVKEYFPKWDQVEELNLHAEAIHHLASVIKLQSQWVKQRSTSLYTDPFLLEEKIMQKHKNQITQIFLKAWHPMVEEESLTRQSFADALRYWSTLRPIKERWPELSLQEVQT
jgi:phage regulator Rha-like protein